MHIAPARRLILTLLLSGTVAVSAAAQTHGEPVRYVAVAMDMDQGVTSRVELVVTRWSTDAQRKQLMETMLNKGADALLEMLQRQPKVGYIQVNGGLGWDLRFAWQEPGEDGGQRVILATDRPMSFWEAANRPRSADYPFTVVELHMKDGQGEGTLSEATKIIPDKRNNIVVLENFDTQRTRLTQVTAQRP